MSAKRFTPEFKEEPVGQIVDRGQSVAEVSARIIELNPEQCRAQKTYARASPGSTTANA